MLKFYSFKMKYLSENNSDSFRSINETIFISDKKKKIKKQYIVQPTNILKS